MFDDEEKPPDLNYAKIIRKVAPLLWPERMHLKARVIMCGITLVIARVANVMVPQLYKGAIDTLTGSNTAEPEFPLGYIVWYTILKMIQSLQRDIRGFIWIPVEQDTSKRVKLKVFTHLHSLSLKYHLTRKTGEVLKVMERGAASLQSLLNMTLFTVGPTLLDLGLVCIVLFFTTEAIFSVVILITMAAYIWVTVRLIEWRKKFRREMIEADNQANDRAVNTLLNFETVKYFGMEHREREELGRNIEIYNGAAIKNESSLYALNAAQAFIVNTGGLICMVLAAYYVTEGDLTVGDFVMILTYLTQVAAPLTWLGTAWRVVQQGFIDMEKMFELLEIEPEIVDAPNAPPLQVSRGTIEYDKVCFKYAASGPAVLRNISFVIPCGTTAAFVGKTGAGKSTIARLLFRFYDLDRDGGGAIRIDGADLRDVTQESLRKAIGVVPQDSVLFNDTIRYNLTYGRPDASEFEIEEAARGAQIFDSIMNFPDKFDTKVGERGLRLSGGEKQRVAIARTILKNPKIVLLDEATSALDTQTEHHIQGALEEMCKGRTTLIIAHRLSTVIHSHQIFVINGGEVSESGSHADLLSKEGEYCEMWKRQQEAREAVPGAGTGSSPLTATVARKPAALQVGAGPAQASSVDTAASSPSRAGSNKPVTYV